MSELVEGVTISALLAIIGAVFVFEGTPGPNIVAVTSCALSSGFRPALLVIAGIIVGDIVFLLIAIFGLTFATQLLAQVLIIIKILGAIYLGWLSWRLWTTSTTNPENSALIEDKSNFNKFRDGLAITMGNPNGMIFYGAFLPLFIDISTLKVNGIIMIIGVIVMIITIITVFYAFLAAQARLLFKSEKSMHKINRISGVFMFIYAIFILSI